MYSSVAEFIQLFPETELTDEKITALLEKASDEIDGLTFNRIVHRGFDNLTDFQKEKISKAVCYHADFIHNYDDMLSSPFSSYAINGVSMAFNGGNIAEQGGVKTIKAVYNLLAQTGLTRRNLDGWR